MKRKQPKITKITKITKKEDGEKVLGRIEDLKWAIKNEKTLQRNTRLALKYKREDAAAAIRKSKRRIAKAQKQINKLKRKKV